jgi:hypothetical protein
MKNDDFIDDDEISELPEPSVWVSCPYCGEEIELLIDVGGGTLQEYVEDCEVCCRPCSVRVVVGDDQAFVSLGTLDES